MIYLELYHGRPIGASSNPHPRLIGPTFEVDRFVTTYGWPRLNIDGENEELEYYDDCIFYDGILYGDFAVSAEPPPDANLQPFKPGLCTIPAHLNSPQLKEK